MSQIKKPVGDDGLRWLFKPRYGVEIMNDKKTQCKQIVYCAKVYEARLKVLAYMQAEDVMKAQEALDRWAEIVKGVDDGNYSDEA